MLPQVAGTAPRSPKLLGIFDAGEGDGFMISAWHAPGAFDEFVDQVVPELQRRGVFRTEYTGPTLRDHLGLDPVPDLAPAFLRINSSRLWRDCAHVARPRCFEGKIMEEQPSES
jgi:hypothetical protein